MYSIKRRFHSFLIQASIVMAYASVAPGLTHGAKYYVATTGSNSYSCTQAQSDSTSKLTVTAGIGCLSAGDTLIIKTGTYNEVIHNVIPAGSSPSARTRIIGHNGAKWTIRPTSAGGCSGGSLPAVIRHVDTSNVEIADMILDANNLCRYGLQIHGASNDWWVHDVEVMNFTGDSAATTGGSGIHVATTSASYPQRALIQNAKVHDGGASVLDHCFYIKGDDHIIERVEGWNCSSHGMHLFGGNGTGAKNNRNIVRYSYFYNNGGRGILIGSGDGNIAHHNISANNGSDGIAIGFNQTTNNKVHNNTIYSNGNECIDIRSGGTNSTIKNNLCLSNSNNTILNSGTGSIIASNRLSTDLTLVVNAENNQFSPRAGSVLIDAGEHIFGFSSGKFLGVAPDQGALEFAPTTPPTNLGTPTSLQVWP